MAPIPHLAKLDAVETKAFKIIGISHDEAESMGLSLCHYRLFGGLPAFFRPFSGLALNKEKILTSKGIYPYDYMDSFMRFKETQLPSQDAGGARQ